MVDGIRASESASEEPRSGSQQRVDLRMGAGLWLQVEMAAKGGVSGTLREWPMLNRALKELGHNLPPATPAAILCDLCRAAYSQIAFARLSARWRELAQAYRNVAGNGRHLSKGNSLRDDAKMLCYCADALDSEIRAGSKANARISNCSGGQP